MCLGSHFLADNHYIEIEDIEEVEIDSVHINMIYNDFGPCTLTDQARVTRLELVEITSM